MMFHESLVKPPIQTSAELPGSLFLAGVGKWVVDAGQLSARPEEKIKVREVDLIIEMHDVGCNFAHKTVEFPLQQKVAHGEGTIGCAVDDVTPIEIHHCPERLQTFEFRHRVDVTSFRRRFQMQRRSFPELGVKIQEKPALHLFYQTAHE